MFWSFKIEQVEWKMIPLMSDWIHTVTRFSEYVLILILDVENYRGFQRKARDNPLGRTGLTHERGMAIVLVYWVKR